jgi:hypothetical protein
MNCWKCADVCRTGALDFLGDTMTVEQVYKVFEQEANRPFGPILPTPL